LRHEDPTIPTCDFRGLGLYGTTLADTPVVIEETQIRSIVTDAGYGDPVLVVQEDDLWRVTSQDGETGEEVTLFVTPEGDLVGAADVARTRIATVTEAAPSSEPVTEAVVADAVMQAGFHNVHDIDYLDDNGVWKAEADDITGEDFELHVDAATGRIVHIEDD
jgi:uncharacterized membrane protein YkoI